MKLLFLPFWLIFHVLVMLWMTLCISIAWMLGVRISVTKNKKLVGHLRWFHFERN